LNRLSFPLANFTMSAYVSKVLSPTFCLYRHTTRSIHVYHSVTPGTQRIEGFDKTRYYKRGEIDHKHIDDIEKALQTLTMTKFPPRKPLPGSRDYDVQKFKYEQNHAIYVANEEKRRDALDTYVLAKEIPYELVDDTQLTSIVSRGESIYVMTEGMSMGVASIHALDGAPQRLISKINFKKYDFRQVVVAKPTNTECVWYIQDQQSLQKLATDDLRYENIQTIGSKDKIMRITALMHSFYHLFSKRSERTFAPQSGIILEYEGQPALFSNYIMLKAAPYFDVKIALPNVVTSSRLVPQLPYTVRTQKGIYVPELIDKVNALYNNPLTPGFINQLKDALTNTEVNDIISNIISCFDIIKNMIRDLTSDPKRVSSPDGDEYTVWTFKKHCPKLNEIIEIMQTSQAIIGVIMRMTSIRSQWNEYCPGIPLDCVPFVITSNDITRMKIYHMLQCSLDNIEDFINTYIGIPFIDESAAKPTLMYSQEDQRFVRANMNYKEKKNHGQGSTATNVTVFGRVKTTSDVNHSVSYPPIRDGSSEENTPSSCLMVPLSGQKYYSHSPNFVKVSKNGKRKVSRGIANKLGNVKIDKDNKLMVIEGDFCSAVSTPSGLIVASDKGICTLPQGRSQLFNENV